MLNIIHVVSRQKLQQNTEPVIVFVVLTGNGFEQQECVCTSVENTFRHTNQILHSMLGCSGKRELVIFVFEISFFPIVSYKPTNPCIE